MQMPNFSGVIVLTGGGSGGHFFPAAALAEEILKRFEGVPIVFVGAQKGIEARLLPETGWQHVLLDVQGLVGRSPWAKLQGMGKLLKSYRVLVRQWKKDRPLAVIATGGYGAAPATLAARALRIPYFLHESNAAPGRLIQLLAKRATRVWMGMEGAEAHLRGARCLRVGTPVREAFRRGFKDMAELGAPQRLLILGGSGGARALNEALFRIAGPLLDAHEDWTILHQAGPLEFERWKDQERHPRHELVPFLQDMDLALESTSLVISRSGASTCAELSACGRPALLVPLPNSAGNHQNANALAMARNGRAVVVPQGPGFEGRLRTAAEGLMASLEARQSLSNPEPNRATERCIEDLAEVLRRP